MESPNPTLLQWLDGLVLQQDHAAPDTMFPPSAAGGRSRSVTGSMVVAKARNTMATRTNAQN